MKFLIVDDSKVARAKTRMIIEDLGGEVVAEAGDGLEAVEKTKKCSPDFVTMDLEMPNMKGDVASKKILEIDPHINIILITSIIDKKELINALKIGVRRILKKPFSPKELQGVVQEIKRKRG